MRRSHLAPMLAAVLAAPAGLAGDGWQRQGLPRNDHQKREAREYRERGAADRIAKAQAKRARKGARRLAQASAGGFYNSIGPKARNVA